MLLPPSDLDDLEKGPSNDLPKICSKFATITINTSLFLAAWTCLYITVASIFLILILVAKFTLDIPNLSSVPFASFPGLDSFILAIATFALLCTCIFESWMAREDVEESWTAQHAVLEGSKFAGFLVAGLMCAVLMLCVLPVGVYLLAMLVHCSLGLWFD